MVVQNFMIDHVDNLDDWLNYYRVQMQFIEKRVWNKAQAFDLTLKAPSLPSLLRVPSGKKKTDAPFVTRSMQRLKQSYIPNLNK